MNIRKATSKDSLTIADYMFFAMEDIVYNFIGKRSADEALNFLRYFIEKKENQYSYQNCWILENEGAVVAVANIYDGASLRKLREPVLQYLKTKYNRDIAIEDETETGEMYIDTLAVNPDMRGRGFGSDFLTFLIEEYVIKNKQTLGLLVDKDNPKAQKLYRKIGFKIKGKKTLTGKEMTHLQIEHVR